MNRPNLKIHKHLMLTVLAGLLLTLAFCAWRGSAASFTTAYAAEPTEQRNRLAAQESGLSPFLYIIPSSDGTELLIGASGLSESMGIPYVNLMFGPGSHKRSYTMAYSDTVEAHVVTIPGLTPLTDMDASLDITTTTGLNSGEVFFSRSYVPGLDTQTLYSADGNLDISIVLTDTIPFDTYIVIAPSYAPPAPLPVGYRQVGNIYTIRAADAFIQTNRPMILRMYYSDLILGGVDPASLAILAWDAARQRWENLAGLHASANQYWSATINRFTTYTLATRLQTLVYLPTILR